MARAQWHSQESVASRPEGISEGLEEHAEGEREGPSTRRCEHLDFHLPPNSNLLLVVSPSIPSSSMSTDNSCASTDPLVTPRRVILRFATASAPQNDEDVYRPFLAQQKVHHQDYYVHIQPRDYDRTHIVIDFCKSSSLPIHRVPHQLYRVTWEDGNPYVPYSKKHHWCGGTVRLNKVSDYKEMGDQWAKKAKDLTSVYRWFW
jgi:hypothetical protein